MRMIRIVGIAIIALCLAYDGGLIFAADVIAFSIDVSRSNGSSSGQTFTIRYLDDGVLVDEETVVLQDINTWTTLVFGGPLCDRIEWEGSASGFSPYGVDNIQYTYQVVDQHDTTWGGVKNLYR